MNTYHKIKTIFKRDMEVKHRPLLENQFSLPEFEYLKDNIWTFTEKVDGTNIRVMFNEGKITFGGKTDRAMLPAELSTKLNSTFLPLESKFAELFNDNPVCLYGEGYGAKIQKAGKDYRSDQDFVLFDIKIGHWWLQRENIGGIAEQLGIEIVPIIGEGTLSEMVEKTKAGFDSIWGSFQAEGIVARPKIELAARSGNRIITKIKCKDFVNE